MVIERIPLRGQMWMSRVSIIRRSFQCGLEVREVGLVDVIWPWERQDDESRAGRVVQGVE